MSLRLLVRRRANVDIDQIADYIGSDSEDAGRRFILAARQDFELLRENPKLGALRHSSRRALKNLRSWPVKGFEKYLIFYLPKRTRIEIIRVLHGARDVARLFNERT